MLNWEAIATIIVGSFSLIVMLVIFGSKMWQMVRTMESNIASNTENLKSIIDEMRGDIANGKVASSHNNSIIEKHCVKIDNLENLLPDMRLIKAIYNDMQEVKKNTRETNGRVIRNEAIIATNIEQIKDIYNKLNR